MATSNLENIVEILKDSSKSPSFQKKKNIVNDVFEDVSDTSALMELAELACKSSTADASIDFQQAPIQSFSDSNLINCTGQHSCLSNTVRPMNYQSAVNVDEENCLPNLSDGSSPHKPDKDNNIKEKNESVSRSVIPNHSNNSFDIADTISLKKIASPVISGKSIKDSIRKKSIFDDSDSSENEVDLINSENILDDTKFASSCVNSIVEKSLPQVKNIISTIDNMDLNLNDCTTEQKILTEKSMKHMVQSSSTTFNLNHDANLEFNKIQTSTSIIVPILSDKDTDLEKEKYDINNTAQLNKESIMSIKTKDNQICIDHQPGQMPSDSKDFNQIACKENKAVGKNLFEDSSSCKINNSNVLIDEKCAQNFSKGAEYLQIGIKNSSQSSTNKEVIDNFINVAEKYDSADCSLLKNIEHTIANKVLVNDQNIILNLNKESDRPSYNIDKICTESSTIREKIVEDNISKDVPEYSISNNQAVSCNNILQCKDGFRKTTGSESTSHACEDQNLDRTNKENISTDFCNETILNKTNDNSKDVDADAAYVNPVNDNVINIGMTIQETCSNIKEQIPGCIENDSIKKDVSFKILENNQNLDKDSDISINNSSNEALFAKLPVQNCSKSLDKVSEGLIINKAAANSFELINITEKQSLVGISSKGNISADVCNVMLDNSKVHNENFPIHDRPIGRTSQVSYSKIEKPFQDCIVGDNKNVDFELDNDRPRSISSNSSTKPNEGNLIGIENVVQESGCNFEKQIQDCIESDAVQNCISTKIHDRPSNLDDTSIISSNEPCKASVVDIDKKANDSLNNIETKIQEQVVNNSFIKDFSTKILDRNSDIELAANSYKETYSHKVLDCHSILVNDSVNYEDNNLISNEKPGLELPVFRVTKDLTLENSTIENVPVYADPSTAEASIIKSLENNVELNNDNASIKKMDCNAGVNNQESCYNTEEKFQAKKESSNVLDNTKSLPENLDKDFTSKEVLCQVPIFGNRAVHENDMDKSIINIDTFGIVPPSTNNDNNLHNIPKRNLSDDPTKQADSLKIPYNSCDDEKCIEDNIISHDSDCNVKIKLQESTIKINSDNTVVSNKNLNQDSCIVASTNLSIEKLKKGLDNNKDLDIEHKSLKPDHSVNNAELVCSGPSITTEEPASSDNSSSSKENRPMSVSSTTELILKKALNNCNDYVRPSDVIDNGKANQESLNTFDEQTQGNVKEDSRKILCNTNLDGDINGAKNSKYKTMQKDIIMPLTVQNKPHDNSNNKDIEVDNAKEDSSKILCNTNLDGNINVAKDGKYNTMQKDISSLTVPNKPHHNSNNCIQPNLPKDLINNGKANQESLSTSEDYSQDSAKLDSDQIMTICNTNLDKDIDVADNKSGKIQNDRSVSSPVIQNKQIDSCNDFVKLSDVVDTGKVTKELLCTFAEQEQTQENIKSYSSKLLPDTNLDGDIVNVAKNCKYVTDQNDICSSVVNKNTTDIFIGQSSMTDQENNIPVISEDKGSKFQGSKIKSALMSKKRGREDDSDSGMSKRVKFSNPVCTNDPEQSSEESDTDEPRRLVIVENENEIKQNKANSKKNSQSFEIRARPSKTLSKVYSNQGPQLPQVCEINKIVSIKTDVSSISGPMDDNCSSSDNISVEGICSKCQCMWNSQILKLLFDGSESVTINSKITYGAMLCINNYASLHYKNLREESVRRLLERAGLVLGKSFAMIQISNLSNQICERIKSKIISCCDVYQTLYLEKNKQKFTESETFNKNRGIKRKTNDSSCIPDEQISDMVDKAIIPNKVFTNDLKAGKSVPPNITLKVSTDVDQLEKSTNDQIKSSYQSLEEIPTNGDIIKTSGSDEVPWIYNMILEERNNLTEDVTKFYDQLPCQVTVTEEEKAHLKRKYITNIELLNIYFMYRKSNLKTDIDTYFKLFFQIAFLRGHILLIPDGSALMKVAESLRVEYTKKKQVRGGSNFGLQTWDTENIFSTAFIKPGSLSADKYPSTREILTHFCSWKTKTLLSKKLYLDFDLRSCMIKLFGEKIHLKDCLGLCTRLYAKFCILLFQQNEPAKAKLYLSLFYYPKKEQSLLKKATVFPTDMSFLPHSNQSITTHIEYLQENIVSKQKRILPEAIIDYKLAQTKKMKAEICNYIPDEGDKNLIHTYVKLYMEVNKGPETLVNNRKQSKKQLSSQVLSQIYKKIKSENISAKNISNIISKIISIVS